MADLTWEEVRDRTTTSLFLVPVGALEQHGPQLPLDTDTVVPRELCLRVASQRPAIVLPAIAYGYKSQPNTGGGERFPGTTSLDGATLTAILRDVVRALASKGARSIAVVNGNFENTYFAIEGIDLALRDLARPAGVRVVHVNWWEQLTAADLDAVFAGSFPGWEAEHAGVVETSLMLALDPGRVRVDRIPTPVRMALPTVTIAPEPDGLVPPSGVLASAVGSSEAIGRGLLERLDVAIGRVLERELPG